LILLIDNYDSFTFNLSRYLTEIGEEVVVVKNDEITLSDIDALNPNALVFSPGPCTPDSSGITLDAIIKYQDSLPMLGVCLGHQAIAQCFGANIIRASKAMHGKVSKLHHNGKGIFSQLPLSYDITRYHSLVVDGQTLPSEFEITAWTQSTSGDLEEIMAIQHKSRPIFGVQFHPESLLTEYGHELLSNFVSLQD